MSFYKYIFNNYFIIRKKIFHFNLFLYSKNILNIYNI